jgi:hypothetical protein
MHVRRALLRAGLLSPLSYLSLLLASHLLALEAFTPTRLLGSSPLRRVAGPSWVPGREALGAPRGAAWLGGLRGFPVVAGAREPMQTPR